MSVIEQLRSAQEDIENLEKAIVKALFLKSQSPKYAVLADFMIKEFLDEIQSKSAKALKIYQDEDSFKKNEIQILEGYREAEDATGNKSLDVWTNYYEKLNEIRDYHDRFTPYGTPAENHDDNWYFLHALDDRSKIPKFSGPEGNGRFLDLHNLYIDFINLKKLNKNNPRLRITLDYITYLSTFDQFHTILISCKDNQYKKYLENLLDYLKYFFNRTQPLLNISQLEDQHRRDFQMRWENRSIRGWEKLPKKNELKTDPLFCLPCNKLFTNKNVYKAHKTGAKHRKAAEHIAELIDRTDESEEIKHYQAVASLECFISRLRETLGDTVEDTMNNIRKKQTRTAEELAAQIYESDEEEEPFSLPVEELKKRSENKEKEESSSSEDERPAYNPLNLPIGYDGKPIPYWLYKLQGLNVEYKCEICGNYSYWGRRAFERHFQEWRHAYGMRCLRIPNTMHFREVTKIDEAITLHKKLIEDHKLDLFRADEEEEFEDSQGNVMSKKKFTDLKRQGLA